MGFIFYCVHRHHEQKGTFINRIKLYPPAESVLREALLLLVTSLQLSLRSEAPIPALFCSPPFVYFHICRPSCIRNEIKKTNHPNETFISHLEQRCVVKFHTRAEILLLQQLTASAVLAMNLHCPYQMLDRTRCLIKPWFPGQVVTQRALGSLVIKCEASHQAGLTRL